MTHGITPDAKWPHGAPRVTLLCREIFYPDACGWRAWGTLVPVRCPLRTERTSHTSPRAPYLIRQPFSNRPGLLFVTERPTLRQTFVLTVPAPLGTRRVSTTGTDLDAVAPVGKEESLRAVMSTCMPLTDLDAVAPVLSMRRSSNV